MCVQQGVRPQQAACSKSGLMVHLSVRGSARWQRSTPVCVVLLALLTRPQDRCGAWAASGECSNNIDFMLVACKASCNTCKALQTPTPLQHVQLASGWMMPSVGFGTAGLGVGTAAAVEYAAAAGYRMFDSAEVRLWVWSRSLLRTVFLASRYSRRGRMRQVQLLLVRLGMGMGGQSWSKPRHPRFECGEQS
jgi:hypothetical protein